jgi:hypothetical protein
MASLKTMTPCKVTRENKTHVALIPKKLAVVGKIVELKTHGRSFHCGKCCILPLDFTSGW